jgi:predicted nucleotide-binding protein
MKRAVILIELKKYPRKVFIIHGHDNEMKNTVARFLEGIGVDAVILHERADESSTIIQKVLDYSNKIGYAIALLSPDDIGYSTNDGPRSKNPRPRQNVILELGIFLGKHGKEKVILLVREREKLEFPK